MGGGLMQLVAYGAQDIYLTGNPQITFFKIVYRRHTNFAMESIQQVFNESPSRDGGDLNAIISRKGDLLYSMHLEVDLVNIYNSEELRIKTINIPNPPEYYIKWVDNTAHALIKECSIEIGGQLIDKHNSQWLDIHSEFFSKTNQLDILLNRAHIDLEEHSHANDQVNANTWYNGENTHKNNILYHDSYGHAFPGHIGTPLHYKDRENASETRSAYPLSEEALPPLKMYIPLQFWFCRHAGLALPLIALQYHDVKLSLTTRNLQYLVNAHNDVAQLLGDTIPLLDNHPSIQLYTDYIYLDTDERRRFAQVSHEYLIEQIQIKKHPFTEASNQIIPLDFNHPVKEIFWVIQADVCLQESANSNMGAILNYPIQSQVSSSRTQNSLNHTIYAPPRVNSESGSEVLNRKMTNKNDYFNYHTRFNHDSKLLFNGQHVNSAFGTAKMVFNGSDRFSERDALYFRTVQHYQAGHGIPRQHIYCYSFALKPEEHQPSGTCNFSRIDNAELHFTTANNLDDARTISIFAINYNILRIMSGMGGLAYSN